MPPSPSLAPPSLLTAWWRPTLGILVAALGILVLSAGMEHRLMPAIHDDSVPTGQVVSEARTVLIVPSGSADGAARRRWSWDRVKSEDQGPARLREPRRLADLLGVDLATGWRAESAHLATVPLHGPGACGDLREALLLMQFRQPGRQGTGWCLPCPSNAAPPYPGDKIDLVSTALFGPADRQPAAVLPVRVLRCAVVTNS
jgi:hypothetical protein